LSARHLPPFVFVVSFVGPSFLDPCKSVFIRGYLPISFLRFAD
jgi:hypothetical protein